ASTVAVGGGRIQALDDAAQELVGPNTRILDASGCAVVPGFVDAHIHFGQYALGRQEVNLDGAATLEAGLELVGEFTRTRTMAWVSGRGWDRNRWGRLPMANEVDGAVGDRPAGLRIRHGTSLWIRAAVRSKQGVSRAK